MDNVKGCLGVLMFVTCLMAVFFGLLGLAYENGQFIVIGIVGAGVLALSWRFLFGPDKSSLSPEVSASSTPSSTIKLDYSRIPQDWKRALVEVGFTARDFDCLHDDIDREYGGSWEVHPERTDLFRAFHLTPFDEVRVVIIGEEPYPTRGVADGLAFSVKAGSGAMPPTLNRILQNLYSDVYPEEPRPSSGDLSTWARRGVLLLNAALTMRPAGSPPPGRSHPMAWSHFTNAVVSAINTLRTPVFFILWGDDAEPLEARILPPHKSVKSAHPSPRNAGRVTRLQQFDHSHPFLEANRFLQSRQVDWRL